MVRGGTLGRVFVWLPTLYSCIGRILGSQAVPISEYETGVRVTSWGYNIMMQERIRPGGMLLMSGSCRKGGTIYIGLSVLAELVPSSVLNPRWEAK